MIESAGPTEGFEDDGVLVAALRNGDELAYEFLVREYGPRMLAVITRMLHKPSDAQDALQDAFIQAFKAIDRFKGEAALTTWLHQIAVRSALMFLRKQKRKREVSVDDLLPRYSDNTHRDAPGPTWTLTPDDLLATDEKRQMVRELIDELPESYREVLLLRDIEEMDTDETADTLGITRANVKTRLHRARQALRTLLEPHMTGEEVSA